MSIFFQITMFWKFNLLTSSHIDSLLEKEVGINFFERSANEKPNERIYERDQPIVTSQIQFYKQNVTSQ